MIPPAQNPYASIGLQTSAQYSNYDGSPSEEMRYSDRRRIEDDEYFDDMEQQQMRGYEEQPEEEYEEEYEEEDNFDTNDDYESQPQRQSYNSMGFSNDIISGDLINYDSPYSNNSFEDREIIATDGNMGNYWSMDNLIGDLQGFQKGGNKSSVDASFGLPEDVFGSGIFNRETRGIKDQSFNEIFGGQDMGIDPQTMYGNFHPIKALTNKISEVKAEHELKKLYEKSGKSDEYEKLKEAKAEAKRNSKMAELSNKLGYSVSSETTTAESGIKSDVKPTVVVKNPELEKKEKELLEQEKKLKESQEEIEKLKRNNRDAYLQSRRHLGFSLNSMDDDDDDYLSMRSRMGYGVGSAGGIEIGMKERSGEDLFGKIGGSESDDDDTTTIQGETDLIGFKSAKPSSSTEKVEMIQGDVFGFRGMGNYGEAEDMFGKSLGGNRPQDFEDVFGNFGVANSNGGGRPMGFAETFGFSIGSQSDDIPATNSNVRTSLTSLNVKNENKKQFNKVRNTPSTGNKRNAVPRQYYRQNNQPIQQQQQIPQRQPEMRGYIRNFFNNNEDYTERFAMTDTTYAFDVGGNLGFDYGNQSPDILGVSGMIGLGDSRVTTYNPKTKTMTITTKKSGKVRKNTKKLNKKNTKSKKTTAKKTSVKKVSKKQNIKSEKDNDVIRDLIWG